MASVLFKSSGKSAEFLAYQASTTTPLSPTISDDVINMDASGGAKTINPPAITNKVQTYRKSDASLNSVIITGVTTLDTTGETVRIVYTGSAWVLLSRYIPSAWTNFTMSITAVSGGAAKGTVSNDKAYWRRENGSLRVRYDYSQTVAGSAGTGTYLFAIPIAVTVDTAILTANTGNSALGACGWAAASTSASTVSIGAVKLYDATHLFMSVGDNTAGPSLVDSTNFALSQTTLRYAFEALLPINGWNA